MAIIKPSRKEPRGRLADERHTRGLLEYPRSLWNVIDASANGSTASVSMPVAEARVSTAIFISNLIKLARHLPKNCGHARAATFWNVDEMYVEGSTLLFGEEMVQF